MTADASLEGGERSRTTEPVSLPTDLTPLVLHGHVIDVLRSLPENSVQTCISSPPYWNLRAYGTPPQVWGGSPGHAHDWHPKTEYWNNRHASVIASGGEDNLGDSGDARKNGKTFETCSCGAWKGELGLEPSPDLFISHLADVYDEVKRVLREDGTCWVNLGDSYCGGGRGSGIGKNGEASLSSRQFWDQNQDDVVPLSKPGNGLKSKDLVGIPWRFAFEAQRRGWYLRSDVIWSKPNPMPESVTDRPTRSHEYIFLLTKNARYYYDADAVRNGFAESTLDRARNHYANPTDNPETDSKHGSGNAKSYPIQGRRQAGYAASTLREIEEGYDGRATKDYASGNAQDPSATKARIIEGMRAKAEQGISGANLRSVWQIATQPYPEAHFATFPEAIPERCIRLGTSEKGACAKCGSPWERQTYHEGAVPDSRVKPGAVESTGRMDVSQGRGGGFRGATSETTGWSPTCSCPPSGPVPCLAMDVFGGSGTTGQVARRLGRRSVLIELNPEYVALARERSGANVPSLEAYSDLE